MRMRMRMRMRMTTLTWRPINRINCTLTSDRLFTKFRSFWLLVEDVFLTLNNIFLKGHYLYLVKTLSLLLHCQAHHTFFTVFMVLWLPKVEFVSVLIAEFPTLMINSEGLHLYVFTVRITVKIHWHKRSFQCSRLISYYSFLSSCYCEKRQKPIWKEMQNINIQFKAMFLKMLPTIGCPSQQCILLLYN